MLLLAYQPTSEHQFCCSGATKKLVLTIAMGNTTWGQLGWMNKRQVLLPSNLAPA